MQIEFIIFDMDGTLVDSEYRAARALRDVLPDLGLSPAELVARYRGVKLASILADISANHAVVLADDIIEKYRQREAELGCDLIEVNPGVTELLDKLRIDFCVASNAPKSKTEQTLKACGLLQYFEHRIYSAYDIGAWKPDPALFVYAARSEAYAPAQCLVVEDSDVGIAAAKAAGMYPLFYNPQGRDTEHTTVETIVSFKDVSRYIA